MTDALQTVVYDPAHTSDMAVVPSAETQPGRLATRLDVDLFHDDAWAEEFERRLTAWEAESTSTSPEKDAVTR